MSESMHELPPTFTERFEALWTILRRDNAETPGAETLISKTVKASEDTTRQIVYRTGYGRLGRIIECMVEEASFAVYDSDLYNLAMNDELDDINEPEWITVGEDAKPDPVGDLVWIESFVGRAQE